MKFLKNFNNNAALVQSENGTEWIVIGSGIGFGKKVGDEIDVEKIDRRFIAENATLGEHSEIEALTQLEAEILEMTSEVIKQIEPLLGLEMNNQQYLVLADHLQFALQRAKEQVVINNQAVRWEVRKLFPKEFQVALKVVEWIKLNWNLILPEGEEVFLTYHFVNIQNGDDQVQDTIKMTQLITNIVGIVQYSYGVLLNEESFNYSRFISHLRYFIIRRIKQEEVDQAKLDPELLSMMMSRYPEAYQVVEQIADFLYKREHWQLEADEKVYLLLHIWRVTSRQIED